MQTASGMAIWRFHAAGKSTRATSCLSDADSMTEHPEPPRIARRIVVHFPGYEPLDAEDHRQRYERAISQTSAAYGFSARVGALDENGAPAFSIHAEGKDWAAETRMTVLDHNGIITGQKARPLWLRLVSGYRSAARIVWSGALWRYVAVAWRFALFFIFPFMLMSLGFFATLGIALLPMLASAAPHWFAASLPLAALFLLRVFLPWSNRLHTLHLFGDWDLAVALARMDDPVVNARLAAMADAMESALSEPADAHLITCHSMGGAMALHALGILLERGSKVLASHPISLVTLGGSGHQVSMINAAHLLRSRIGRVLAARNLFWLDVQCMTDPCNFYGAKAGRDNGVVAVEEPPVLFIRMKRMLSAERYRRIKYDLLRVHRQFVLGSDTPSRFDFQVLTAGPLPAAQFLHFTEATPPVL